MIGKSERDRETLRPIGSWQSGGARGAAMSLAPYNRAGWEAKAHELTKTSVKIKILVRDGRILARERAEVNKELMRYSRKLACSD
jgi:hypothetical protein